MSCEHIESKIPDYMENRLPPAPRAEVEAHLAGCAGCRTLARQLEQLDVALAAGITAPVLPAGFAWQLRARIDAEPAILTEAQRAQRKCQLQAEFAAGLERLRRETFSWGKLLDAMTRSLRQNIELGHWLLKIYRL